MNNHEYKNYILNQTNEKRKELLASLEVRNELLNNPEYHYSFVWLVQELDEDSLRYLLDDELLNQMIGNDTLRLVDKFNAIMTSAKLFVNEFLSNELFYEYLLNKEKLWGYINSLNQTFSNPFFDYILIKNPKKVFIINFFNEKVQLELLNEEKIIQMMNLEVDFSFIRNLKPLAMEKAVNDPVLSNKLMNFYPDVIADMASLNVNFPLSIQSNEIIIDKFVEIEDIASYRFMMEKLTKSNLELYENVRNKRNVKYDEYINNITNAEFDKKKIIEILIDRYFEDLAYNFYSNLREIVNYIDESQKKLIEDNNKNIYKKILDFEKYSVEELVNLYQMMNNNIDYVEVFYDDYQKVKNDLYQDINDSSIKSSDIIDNPTLIKEGISVLELKGEKFTAIAHTSRGLLDDVNQPSTTSVSLIGDRHIGFFGDEASIHVGFDCLPIDQIMNIHHDDSFSSREYGTEKINQIRTKARILDETVNYNEILLYQRNKKTEGNLSPKTEFIKPSYLIALNEINSEILELAKTKKMPILLIYEEYYYKPETGGKSFDSSYSTEYNRKSL